MSPLDLIPSSFRLYAEIAVVAVAATAAAAGAAWVVHHERDIGRAEINAKWTAENLKREQEAFAEAEANAKESKRRLERQQENQLAQDAQLAAARSDAARDHHDADQLRDQNASTAKQWRDALDHPPVVGDRAAAGDAIGVLADVLSRADKRAGILASYADAARIAGIKCERDYDALTQGPAP